MRMLITDLLDLPIQAGDELKAPSGAKEIHHCIGCFGCWIKTPGRCVIKDSYMNMGEQLSKCEELIFVSKCTYGGLSPFVKNVLDRSIGYISPNFTIINNEMHHKRRYDNIIKISVYFYNEEMSKKEKNVAKDLIHAQALNFHAEVNGIYFFNTPMEVKEALKK